MRVIQLITQTRGGPVDHAVDVAVELARRGLESHLVGPDGPYGDRLVDGGVQWHRASMTHTFELSGARALAARLAEIGPGVLHCQDRRAGLVGRALGRRRDLPTVYTLHGVPDSLAPLVPGNIRFAPPSRRDRVVNLTGERVLARLPRVSRVVVPCDALAEYAVKHARVPADHVRVVHNGTAPSGTCAEPRGTGYPVAAWLGVMQPVKRLPQLVAAATTVPDLRLHLIGDGPERTAVEAVVHGLGAADRVTLAGYHDEPATLLARADLFVLPSAAEACPMALLQAMSCGLPVVASRAGGIPEIVRDGVDGLLVPTGDDEALGAALRVLTEDPALRRRMGRNARQRVQQSFTTERCVDDLLAVYGQVAS